MLLQTCQHHLNTICIRMSTCSPGLRLHIWPPCSSTAARSVKAAPAVKPRPPPAKKPGRKAAPVKSKKPRGKGKTGDGEAD